MCPPAPWGESPEERLLSPDGRDQFRRAIGKLEPAQREVVTLRDIRGWSPGEIRDLLGISEAVQRRLLHQARAALWRPDEQFLQEEERQMVTDALNCREFVELVTDYLEGALPAAAQAKMELHQRVCRDCVTYLEQIRLTIRVLGTVGAEPVPDRTMDTLLRAFRRRSRMARRAHVYDLGSPARAVSPGSHLVQYYATQEERDEFADHYVAAGLRAGDACVILGDPLFVQQTAERIQSQAEACWPGQLFTAAWDRPPSPEAVRDFAELHTRLNTRGPVDLLPEVRLPGAISDSPARGVRGLGNFQHWSSTPEGSRCLLQICASVHDSYLRSRDIVVCQYEVANRPAALRWGGLALHTHVVDGTCLADPMAVLERSMEDGIAKMTNALAGLEAAVAAGRVSETLQTLRRAQSDLGEMRELLRRLHISDRAAPR